MSAFIVGNKHISFMLKIAVPQYAGDGPTYYHNGRVHPFGGYEHRIGQILVDENTRSVNYRYRETKQAEKFQLVNTPEITPVAAIKACDGYIYQACETPDFYDTEARAIVKTLRERAIKRLDGYSDASWHIC